VNVSEGSYAGEFGAEDATSATEGVSALEQIVAGFRTFSALFAEQLPSPDDPALRGLFDEADFLHDGVGLDLFLSEPTSDPNLVGIQFTNISVDSLDPVAGTGVVSFDIVLDGLQMTDAPSRFEMVRSNGTWLMQGNQRLAEVSVETRAFLYPGETPARIDTGLSLSVEDNGDHGIDYAVVTGPGLPAEGVVLAKTMEHDNFRIFDGTAVTDSNFYELNEGAVAGIPSTGAEYSFALWSAGETPENLADDALLAEYTVKILARPLRPSELSAANFPVVTAPSASAWADYTGGAVDVRWTIPEGYRSDYVYGYLRGDGWVLETEETLAPDETSATLTMAAEGPMTLHNLSVSVMDIVGRSFTTVLW
jgi:hypothetical protein